MMSKIQGTHFTFTDVSFILIRTLRLYSASRERSASGLMEYLNRELNRAITIKAGNSSVIHDYRCQYLALSH